MRSFPSVLRGELSPVSAELPVAAADEPTRSASRCSAPQRLHQPAEATTRGSASRVCRDDVPCDRTLLLSDERNTREHSQFPWRLLLVATVLGSGEAVAETECDQLRSENLELRVSLTPRHETPLPCSRRLARARRPQHRCERADARDSERAARAHRMRNRCAAGAEGASAAFGRAAPHVLEPTRTRWFGAILRRS
jgi:hypothetical protein